MESATKEARYKKLQDYIEGPFFMAHEFPLDDPEFQKRVVQLHNLVHELEAACKVDTINSILDRLETLEVDTTNHHLEILERLEALESPAALAELKRKETAELGRMCHEMERRISQNEAQA